MAHILIVDDEQDILDICKTYFEYEGHQVVTASDGQQAIHQYILPKLQRHIQ